MLRLIFASVVALVAATAAFAQAALSNIDNAGLEALMARGVPVVDIRTPPEWAQTGTIAGAHKIMAFDQSGKLAPDFIERLAQVARPGDEVALICRSGSRTAVLSKALTEQLGYTHLYNVEKGMNRWIGEGKPVTR